MRAAVPLALVLALASGLAGCLDTGDDDIYAARPIAPPPPPTASPMANGPLPDPTPEERAAVEQACNARFASEPDRLCRCLNGDTWLIEIALVRDCYTRYSDTPETLTRCVSTAEAVSWTR